MTQRATYSYRTSVFTKSRLWLLALAAIFGWCFGSVRCFGQSQDSELTFLLPAGRLECFFQTAVKNGTMEVEYQVIAGAGMDVDFTILSPEGIRLIVESRRSDGVHPTVEGDYQICFDNSFSRFSEKMVFFEIIIEGQGGDVGGDEEWAGLEEPDGSLLEYKLEDIRVRCMLACLKLFQKKKSRSLCQLT
uniref:Transmembrane p24 trafficking protein 1b n=1 Tax=Lates calcarifer TaxID=8187 RepID=A0A4W6DIL5_LATCA